MTYDFLLSLAQAIAKGLLTGMVYGLMALGLSVIFGVMRIVNFAHGEMMVVGMYLAWMAFEYLEVTPMLALPAIAAVFFVAGYALQRGLVSPFIGRPEHQQFLLLLAVAILLVTVVGYALGPIIIDKKLRDVPGLAVIAASLAINAVVYAPFAALTWPSEPVPPNAIWSVAILGSLCTAIAFLGFFALIKEVGPSRSTLITYINPAVAVILGILVLSEPLTLGLAIGFPLVLLGSWLATRRAPALESEPHA